MQGGVHHTCTQQAQPWDWSSARRDVCRMYRPAVTRVRRTSSNGEADLQGVGGHGLFMVANNMTPDDLVDGNREGWHSPSRGGVLQAAGPSPGASLENCRSACLRGRKPLEVPRRTSCRRRTSRPPAPHLEKRSIGRPAKGELIRFPALPARLSRDGCSPGPLATPASCPTPVSCIIHGWSRARR